MLLLPVYQQETELINGRILKLGILSSLLFPWQFSPR
jgi:hypothetical protein